LADKIRTCRCILRDLGRVAVAFSGGADSAFLLALAARTLGRRNVLAVTGVSASLPARERRSARRLAGRLGVELVEVRTPELSDPAYAANPSDRCFHCKSHLFRLVEQLALARGCRAVLTGANADDAGDSRPGLRAGRAWGVRNPLMEAGLTKEQIRRVSRDLGLSTWDKPASACLASRVPYGSPITAERLRRIERAEDVLHRLGFRRSRVRDHDGIARVEVAPEQFARLMPRRGEVAGGLKRLGFRYVTLDLEGFRSGSMNEGLPGKAGGADRETRPQGKECARGAHL
jgi:uncharacterized protein